MVAYSVATTPKVRTDNRSAISATERINYAPHSYYSNSQLQSCHKNKHVYASYTQTLNGIMSLPGDSNLAYLSVAQNLDNNYQVNSIEFQKIGTFLALSNLINTSGHIYQLKAILSRKTITSLSTRTRNLPIWSLKI